MTNDISIKLFDSAKSDFFKLQNVVAYEENNDVDYKKKEIEKDIVCLKKIRVIRITESKNKGYFELLAKVTDENENSSYEKTIICAPDNIDSIMKNLESYALIAINDKKTYLIKCIGIDEANKLFDITENNYKDNAFLMCYLQCPESDKERLIRRYRGEAPHKSGTVVKRDYHPVNRDSVIMEYAFVKKIMPESIWEDVGLLMEEEVNSKYSSSQRSNIRRKIDFFLSFPFETKPNNYDKEKMKYILDSKIYGRNDVKKQIIEALSIKNNITKSPRLFCITGKKGMGKNLIAKAIAECESLFYETLSLDGSFHESDVFLGSSNIYENASEGEFARILHRVGSGGCVIIDGFKDASSAIKSNFTRAIQVGELTDMMLQIPIPVNNMTFVLVAEDSKYIPRELYDQASKINLDVYNEEERIGIGRSFILKTVKKEFALDDCTVKMTDDVEKFLCNMYTVTSSMDEVVSNYRKLIGEYITKNDTETKKNKTIKLTMDDAKAIFCLDEEYTKVVRDMSSLEKKFRHNKARYPKEDRKLIENLFEEYYSREEKSAESNIIKDRISFSVNFIPGKTEKCENFPEKIKEIMSRLDDELYAHEESKKAIFRAICEGYLKCGDIYGTLKLFLCGAAGTGKTSIARIIADAMNIPFIKISLNGMTESEIIKGFSSGFHKAKMGILAEKLMEKGSRRAVVLLDEVEKASQVVLNTLYDIVDPSEGKYYDTYLERYIPTTGFIIIASGNDISKLPAAFLDRFELVKLSGYTDVERKIIGLDYVLPKIVKELGIKDRLTMDEDAVELISQKYAHTGSIRPIEKKIRQVLLDKEGIMDENSKSVIHITKDDVVKSLGALPIEYGNRPDIEVYPPGVVNCLSVRGGLGNVSVIEAVKTPYLDKEKITGLPKKVIKESIENARVVVSNILGKLEKTSILFSEGAIYKDGPSAGITIAIALYSLHTGISVSKDIAFSGEIDILGYIYPVGLEEKLSAAITEGLSTVYIPSDNYRLLKEDNKLCRYEGLNIIPVNHISEVIKDLFSEKITNDIDISRYSSGKGR